MEDDNVVGQDNTKIRRKKKQNVSQSQRIYTQFSGEEQVDMVQRHVF